MTRIKVATCVVGCALLIAACAQTRPAPDFHALVASPDRSAADRTNDVRRKPEQLLAFYGVRPGMTVVDLGTGGGYNAELLARAVGPSGKVYAQNPRDAFENMKGRFEERTRNAALKNLVHVARDFEDPVPPEARKVDLVTFNFIYHDTTYMGVDRAKMNRAVFEALKPGGIYIIADHSGRPGTGASEGKTLHRIEEALVRGEVEAAGFRFVAEGGFLRSPDDPRDASVFKPKQPNDEFVLKFIKP